jgi:hypothetical protein
VTGLRAVKERLEGIENSFGVNDTNVEDGISRVSTKQSLINVRKMLSTSLSLYPTLMVGPPPIADADQNRRTQYLAAQVRLVAADVGVPYLDVYSSLERSAAWMHEVYPHFDTDDYFWLPTDPPFTEKRETPLRQRLLVDDLTANDSGYFRFCYVAGEIAL